MINRRWSFGQTRPTMDSTTQRSNYFPTRRGSNQQQNNNRDSLSQKELQTSMLYTEVKRKECSIDSGTNHFDLPGLKTSWHSAKGRSIRSASTTSTTTISTTQNLGESNNSLDLQSLVTSQHSTLSNHRNRPSNRTLHHNSNSNNNSYNDSIASKKGNTSQTSLITSEAGATTFASASLSVFPNSYRDPNALQRSVSLDCRSNHPSSMDRSSDHLFHTSALTLRSTQAEQGDAATDEWPQTSNSSLSSNRQRPRKLHSGREQIRQFLQEKMSDAEHDSTLSFTVAQGGQQRGLRAERETQLEVKPSTLLLRRRNEAQRQGTPMKKRNVTREINQDEDDVISFDLLFDKKEDDIPFPQPAASRLTQSAHPPGKRRTKGRRRAQSINHAKSDHEVLQTRKNDAKVLRRMSAGPVPQYSVGEDPFASKHMRDTPMPPTDLFASSVLETTNLSRSRSACEKQGVFGNLLGRLSIGGTYRSMENSEKNVSVDSIKAVKQPVSQQGLHKQGSLTDTFVGDGIDCNEVTQASIQQKPIASAMMRRLSTGTAAITGVSSVPIVQPQKEMIDDTWSCLFKDTTSGTAKEEQFPSKKDPTIAEKKCPRSSSTQGVGRSVRSASQPAPRSRQRGQSLSRSQKDRDRRMPMKAPRELYPLPLELCSSSKSHKKKKTPVDREECTLKKTKNHEHEGKGSSETKADVPGAVTSKSCSQKTNMDNIAMKSPDAFRTKSESNEICVENRTMKKKSPTRTEKCPVRKSKKKPVSTTNCTKPLAPPELSDSFKLDELTKLKCC